MNETLTNWIGHTLSGFAIVGTLFGVFPVIAAVAALTWYLIQIWESATVQAYLHTRRIQKIARLKMEIDRLAAAEKVSIARKKRKVGKL